MTDEATNRFLERARASLDERSQRVRPEMASQLSAARSQAIESRPLPVFRGWMPAMASAFGIVMAVAIWFGNTNQDIPQGQTIEQLVYENRPADIEMLALAKGKGLELMQELDFYTWLEQEESRTS
jgi:hypothetical protein